MGSTPTLCGGGGHWRGGVGADYCCNQGGWGGYGGGGGGAFIGDGSGGGGGFSGGGGGTQAGPAAGGGGSFNAGTDQANLAGIQLGDGYVTLQFLPAAAVFPEIPQMPGVPTHRSDPDTNGQRTSLPGAGATVARAY
jgi:hypothetical protein